MALPDFTTQDPATYKAALDAACNLNRKILEIGDWNMNFSASGTQAHSGGVVHGLDMTKIRSANVLIRDNTHSVVMPFDTNGDSGYVARIGSTRVYMLQSTISYFDDALFDSTGYNRGWIELLYTD